MLVTDGNKMQLNALINICNQYKIKLIRLGFPEIDLCEVKLSKIITSFSNVFYSETPEIVYLPNRSDVHSDHRKTFEASQACIKSFRYPFIKKVLMMEIISETDFSPALPENIFIPNVFVDISTYFETKISMVEKFDSELLMRQLSNKHILERDLSNPIVLLGCATFIAIIVMEKLKIAFIGGMTDGKIVYDYLSKNKYVDLCLSITYPDSSLVSRHVDFPESPNIIKTLSANKHADKFSNLDYVFVAGWSELLCDEILKSVKKV